MVRGEERKRASRREGDREREKVREKRELVQHGKE